MSNFIFYGRALTSFRGLFQSQVIIQNGKQLPLIGVNIKRFLSANPETVTLNFVKERTGETLSTKAKVGANIYDVVIDNDIDLDGFGACEGTMACVTCHLIFSKKHFDKLQSPATEDEMDMLDMAWGLSDTSRLGCQLKVEKWMDGIDITVPAEKNDARTF